MEPRYQRQACKTFASLFKLQCKVHTQIQQGYSFFDAECEGIAKEIFSLLDMNEDGALDDEDLRSAELGTNGEAITNMANAIMERWQVRS